jgi:hypothetical protein
VIVCIWQKTEAGILADLQNKLHGTAIVTSMAEAVSAAAALAAGKAPSAPEARSKGGHHEEG